MYTQTCRWRTFVKSRSGTTLPAAFYPSPEMYSGDRDKLLASSGATNPFAEILALRQARCTRLNPCPRSPILVLPRSGPYLSPWLSFPCVPDIVSSSSTMHSCIRIQPRPSIPNIPAPLSSQSSAPMCPPLSSVLVVYPPHPSPPLLHYYQCILVSVSSFKPRRPRVPDVVPASIIPSKFSSWRSRSRIGHPVLPSVLRG
jgi:hypothetical protein